MSEKVYGFCNNKCKKEVLSAEEAEQKFAEVDEKIKNAKPNVVDNLLSTSTDLPLSANQGRELNNKLVDVENDLSKINVYVGTDGKLHFVDKEGADSALPFSQSVFVCGTAGGYNDGGNTFYAPGGGVNQCRINIFDIRGIENTGTYFKVPVDGTYKVYAYVIWSGSDASTAVIKLEYKHGGSSKTVEYTSAIAHAVSPVHQVTTLELSKGDTFRFSIGRTGGSSFHHLCFFVVKE